MELTVYNPQKSRLETLNIEITEKNTTWFGNSRKASDVYMITDFKGGIIIKKLNFNYPIWLYDISRTDIDYSQKKAKQILRQYNY
jgi:hypothetical protein